ncbi:MAG: acetyl-CoA carboxylase biotin carboxyl carrier protein [Pyrinomonadaceae bacterium]
MTDQANRETAAAAPAVEEPKRDPETAINMAELHELIALMTENGLTEFELERGGFRVRLSRDLGSSGPAVLASGPQAGERRAAVLPSASHESVPHSVALHPGAQAETAALEDQDLFIITSPIVGTFYRSASPTADTFVRIGSQVEAETVVCIIEAMKLMNEIQAETRGEVAKIYVENGQAVEFGQPLFGVKQ